MARTILKYSEAEITSLIRQDAAKESGENPNDIIVELTTENTKEIVAIVSHKKGNVSISKKAKEVKK